MAAIATRSAETACTRRTAVEAAPPVRVTMAEPRREFPARDFLLENHETAQGGGTEPGMQAGHGQWVIQDSQSGGRQGDARLFGNHHCIASPRQVDGCAEAGALDGGNHRQRAVGYPVTELFERIIEFEILASTR